MAGIRKKMCENMELSLLSIVMLDSVLPLSQHSHPTMLDFGSNFVR